MAFGNLTADHFDGWTWKHEDKTVEVEGKFYFPYFVGHYAAAGPNYRVHLPVVAGVKIWRGSTVVFDDTYPYEVTYGSNAAAQPFAGACIKTVDNSAGSGGDLSVAVEPYGLRYYKYLSPDPTLIGKVFYVDGGSSGDPATVQYTDQTGAPIGVCVGINTTHDVVALAIDHYALNV